MKREQFIEWFYLDALTMLLKRMQCPTFRKIMNLKSSKYDDVCSTVKTWTNSTLWFILNFCIFHISAKNQKNPHLMNCVLNNYAWGVFSHKRKQMRSLWIQKNHIGICWKVLALEWWAKVNIESRGKKRKRKAKQLHNIWTNLEDIFWNDSIEL